MGRELFVYWRVAGPLADAAAAASRMQSHLRESQPGLVTRLYRKLDGDRCTLMETYALPGGDIDDALQQRIEATAATTLAACCAGTRHTEAFDDCA